MDEANEAVEVLKEIRANQRIQLERQAQALALQKEQFEMVKAQYARAEKIQDRAEAIQDTGAKMMGTARKAMAIILPVVIALVIYLSWLIFR
jgi:uncharacterized membrane protein (DUF106 family)